MKLAAFKKTVIVCSALAAMGAMSGAMAGVSIDTAERSAMPSGQAVNGGAKTDRLELPDVVSTVVRTDKANRTRQSLESEETPGPVARASDDPGAVVEPAATAEETTRNYSEEPAERNSPSWSGWSYSKGLLERTDRRARYLWNTLTDRK